MRGSALAVLAAALLAAGCGSSDSDRWRYERIVYEEMPAVASRDDAAARHERLGSLPRLTLRECYEMALYRSETLAIDGEELARLQARFEQIRGEALPRVAFQGSYFRQDKPPPSSGLQQSLTLNERTEYRFAAQQPLFAGLREFYALRQTNALYRGQEHALRHARLLLYGDVADAFYAVLEAGRELATTQDSLRLADERLEELVQRNRAGISRRSEVLAQEAEAASIRATVERLKGVLAVAVEVLKFLTGLPAARELEDVLPEPAEVPPVAEYLVRAARERHDLRAADERVLAAGEGVGIARSGYFPTADLDVRYFTHREGVSAEIDWDLTLSFEVPLFEGMVTQAKLREARSAVRAAEFDRARLRRDVALQVNRAYADLKAFQSELASLGTAVASAEENYEIVQAEYRRSIATNIDVLTAFEQLQQARLRRDRARFQAKRSGVRLEVLSGVLPGVGK
jgi:outer membrane protein TolC